jgi:hypothetical protein
MAISTHGLDQEVISALEFRNASETALTGWLTTS